MTNSPRLATIEKIMEGSNPFELVDVQPFGTMERWRAEAMLIGSTGGIQSVYNLVRSDASAAMARADETEVRNQLIQHVCDKIVEFEKRFDALTTRLAEAEKLRQDAEAHKAKFDAEPLELPPDIQEYQTRTPPTEIRDDPPPDDDREASKLPDPPLPSVIGDDDDTIGDLPKELEEPPDPVPEPSGSVYPQPIAISLNEE
jgi:hypothetical protein